MNQNQEKISFHSLNDLISNRNCCIECTGLHGPAKAYFMSKLCMEHKTPIFIVTSSPKEGEKFLQDLHFFLKNTYRNPIYFPPYNILPFKRIAYHNETAAKRIKTLYCLTQMSGAPIVILPISALLQKLIPKQELCNYAELVIEGEDIERNQFIEKLGAGGYVHSMIVEECGDFCVRGGIVDVFSPLYSDPLRIEFFGDTVESLRFFSAANQRKTKIVQEAIILPAKEAILKTKHINQVINNIRKQALTLNVDTDAIRDITNRIKNEGIFPEIESLISLVYPKLDTIFDYAPNNALFVLIEPNELEKVAEKLQEQATQNYSSARKANKLCVEPDDLYLTWQEAKSILEQKSQLHVERFATPKQVGDKNYAKFDFSNWDDADVKLNLKNYDEAFCTKRLRSKVPKYAVHTELISSTDLKKGDFIVHIEHGIGQYDGLVKLKLNGATNDFLLIFYRDNDKLYLPVDRMNMTQKYMGMGEFVPTLDKMGDKSWNRVKEKVKKSVEKIAKELLKVYAARKVKKGYTYKNAGKEFSDFEAGFPYEETSDQMKAIDNVLSDMEQPTPMDRLVCGDVGYGKTEVALRASFLAVSNGKQAAILVPTTVLAEQHFETFSDRFKDCAVNIECLSRFRSTREQKAIVNNLQEGKIDIIIGTHRLIQKDVFFKDLGLFIIDEEQRFGVKHKEVLKKIRNTVDVLALTATPIPRTLHLSLMGVRDISVISTPPERRQAVKTYICEFDDAVICDAIKKELNRNGQIFFVHNNVHHILAIAKHLQELVPEARLDVAHGRLSEKDLEKVMRRFINKEIDMLICTTIIESGLDIPAANTIMINRADRFGLAQIYQLRGRVGRSEEQAYAYLFIPNETTLSKDAQKRLKVLMEHSDLGSGFQIAMNDLKIRGGGSVLGISQSGHIAAVGYDMFLQLMEQSVANLKGEITHNPIDPEINITMSAYLPESYIPDIDQRLSAYKRLSKMTELREIADFKNELIDRFGALPKSGANLLLKIMLKTLSIKAQVKRLDLSGQYLCLYFSENLQKPPFKTKLLKSGLNGLLRQIKNILNEIITKD